MFSSVISAYVGVWKTFIIQYAKYEYKSKWFTYFKYMFQVSSLSELQDSFMPTSSTSMYTIVQMCMRLASVPDTNFTFDAKVTTNNGHLNEHYKVNAFDFMQWSNHMIFFIADCSSTYRHSPPWSSWSSWSSWTPLTHWLKVTGTQQPLSPGINHRHFNVLFY